jgi:hypothetical protein
MTVENLLSPGRHPGIELSVETGLAQLWRGLVDLLLTRFVVRSGNELCGAQPGADRAEDYAPHTAEPLSKVGEGFKSVTDWHKAHERF